MNTSEYSKALGFVLRRAKKEGINTKRLKLLMAMDEMGRPALVADIETLARENMNYDAIDYLRESGFIQHENISKGSHKHYNYRITEKGQSFL
jgi:hypothetical protein